jgi:hypothetical protein
MKNTKPKDMTVDQLVARFTEIAIEQDRALLHSEISKYNKLYDQLTAVRTHLKDRSGDQRRELLKLFDPPNWQVRLMPAHATLAIAPGAARRMLETIAASRHFPQAGDAGMSLSSLDRGIYKPQ